LEANTIHNKSSDIPFRPEEFAHNPADCNSHRDVSYLPIPVQKKKRMPNISIDLISKFFIISVNRRQGKRIYRINLPSESAEDLSRI
jgi:hypothetical protein